MLLNRILQNYLQKIKATLHAIRSGSEGQRRKKPSSNKTEGYTKKQKAPTI
jgi:hypothetical protein